MASRRRGRHSDEQDAMSDTPATILVVDDDAASLSALFECLRRASYRVLVAQDGTSALERAVNGKPALILLDVMMPDIDGFETCRRLKRNAGTADIPVLFLTALSDTNEKVKGFEAGAVDYLTKPFQWEEVLARVRTHLKLRAAEHALVDANRTLEARVAERTAELETSLSELDRLRRKLQAENSYLQEEIGAEMRNVVGSSRALRAVLDQVERVARSDATVLINGETGTGKELIARAVHDSSPRRERPLVKLNCAAISAGLVESELFGHVKGAFTGATDKNVGRFQLADGGTLFLDEIGELPLETQVKLLRVLQEHEFEPVGSAKTQRVDVRVIAATNRRLEDEVARGKFRSDLYYRLNVFPVEVPPLRARREDIPELAAHFVERFSRRLGRSTMPLAPQAVEQLMSHDWPGNIRELQNTIERALIVSVGGELTIDWPLVSSRPAQHAQVDRTNTNAGNGASATAPGPDAITLVEVERQHIVALLKRTGGVIEGPKGAAKMLDMKPSTVRYRIRKLGIRKTDYLP
jgi:DNA-binding NtrC family response regulator